MVSRLRAPASSSGGLNLPADNSLLDRAYANDLPAAGDPAKVSQILASDGYTRDGGHHWVKNGQPIKFSIEDPMTYTDYATDAQLIASELNALGFEVIASTASAGYAQWYADYPVGALRRDDPLGASRAQARSTTSRAGWIQHAVRARVGKSAGGDWERFHSPQAQAALAKFEGTDDACGAAAGPQRPAGNHVRLRHR